MKSTNDNGSSALPSYGTVAETVVIDDETQPLVVTTATATTTTPTVVIKDGDEDRVPHCRDPFFAILFWAHMIVMIWLGFWVAPEGYDSVDIDFSGIKNEIRKSDDVTEQDMAELDQFVTTIIEYAKVYPIRILWYLIVPCLVLAFAIAFLVTVVIVKPFPKPIVYSSLVGSLVLTVFVMISSSWASGSFVVVLMTGFGLAAVIYYVTVAWRMVPFAAVNLKVALEGMSRNCGIYIVGCMFAELGFIWVIFWACTVTGVSLKMNAECKAAHPDVDFDDMTSDEYDDVCDPPLGVILFFLLSLYWTSTVIMNTVQVTVAGVTSTWCFCKTEADNCCSSAVFASLYRSVTFSFGSICLGSLLQALMSLFRYVVETARNNRDRDDSACGNIVLCVLECLARLLEDIMEYFNQWAYVFVGIYGYSYLESGKRVMELFRARGWTSIITDNLVGYVLGVITFTNGLLTAAAAVLVEHVISKKLKDPTHPEVESYLGLNRVAASLIGFVIGIWVCSVMMSVIKGAVNTLIVCWADSPAVMEAEHPDLTKEMADAWTFVFPEAAVQIRPAYAVVV